MDIYDQFEEKYEKQRENKHYFLIFEIMIIAVLAIMILGTLIWLNSPEKVVKDQIKDLSVKKWAQVYDRLYFKDKENRFLDKEFFVATMKMSEENEKPVRIYDVDIEQTDKKIFQITYMENGEKIHKVFNLFKENGKWKIDGNEYLSKNIKIYAPEEAQVCLDGVELKNRKNSKFYRIPAVFKGTHYILAEAENRKKYRDIITTKEDQKYEIKMKLKQDIIEKAGKNAVLELKSQYNKKVLQKQENTILNLNNNKVTAVQTGQDSIEVSIQSEYEIYKNDKKTASGICENKFVYIYKKGKVELEKIELQEII